LHPTDLERAAQEDDVRTHHQSLIQEHVVMKLDGWRDEGGVLLAEGGKLLIQHAVDGQGRFVVAGRQEELPEG
jgi:hypothetical protein